MKSVFILLTILTIHFQTLIAAPFLKGHYYDGNGKKIEGLIKFSRASFSVFGSKPSSIKFKPNSDSKALKLTPDDISSFVVGSDSFAIVQNIKINSISGEYVKDFAQVIESGSISLFVHKSTSGNGQMVFDNDRYVISKGSKFIGIWNYKKQKDEIAKFFEDRQDLKDKILSMDESESIQKLVKEYNQAISH